MKIERLNRLNPSFSFYTAEDELFQKYGQKIDYASSHLFKYVYENIPAVGLPFHYEANYPELHHFAIVKRIQRDIFKNREIQFGIISGFSDYLDVLLWRQGRECLIAFTDCIMVLENIRDIQSHRDVRHCFCLKKGDCIVLYPDTMRSNPIPAQLNGFTVGTIHQKDKRIRCINR